MLYRAVAENLETTLALCREEAVAEDPVPAYVERELRQYLRCGILAWGFGRLHCDACGRDYLVAFSGKSRTLCPACTTRRMAEIAAHRVDHVFPRLPVRQWVVSAPKRLR